MHYPPVHLFSFYKQKFGYKGGELPVTEDLCNREMTLPLYPTMTSDADKFIAETIRKFLN